MGRQVSLDSIKDLRLVNDKPIRLLLFAEAISNLGVILIAFLYPSAFISFLFKPDKQITPLTEFILYLWNVWLIVLTALMFAAVPSKYNTPTLTAGLVHVRRFLYWNLLGTEVFLACILTSTSHRTIASVGFAIFCIFVVIGRFIVLFPKKEWFGTVLIEYSDEKKK